MSGWRSRISTLKAELSVLDVLLKGTKVVIPVSMSSQMLSLVHEGHLGIEKCAREILYWRGIAQRL